MSNVETGVVEAKPFRGDLPHFRQQLQDQIADAFKVTTMYPVNRTATKGVCTPVHATVHSNVAYAVHIATYVEATHRELNE